MPFPVIQASLEDFEVGTNSTNWSPNISSLAPAAGDLLVAVIVAAVGSQRTGITASGWTLAAETFGNSNTQSWLFTRTAAGSDTFTLNKASQNTHCSAVFFRISGAQGTIAQLAYNSFAAPDSPALTPGWGADDTLWFTTAHSLSATTVAAYPASYTLLQDFVYNGGAAPPLLAYAARNLNASSENPGAFSIGGAFWQGWTIAVRPAAAPISFGGTVPTQTGTTGGPFSWTGAALSSFFSNGTAPYTYAVQTGTLPAGLTLNSSTGVISGTPTHPGAIGTANIVIRATDAASGTADTNSFAITITDGTPAITAHPSNATATEPSTAGFAVTATGANLSYQWQRSTNGGGSWANVSGGTGGTTASYTTPASTVTGGSANNGDQYRCVVTNSAGAVTSNAATLTVNAAAGSKLLTHLAHYG